MSAPLDAIFQTKYDEFAAALADVFPEMATVIKIATDLSAADRVQMYKAVVLPSAGNPKRDPTKCPGMVLPGVMITEAVWTAATEGTKKAINQFLSIMTFSFVMKDGEGMPGAAFGGDAFRTFAENFMNQWRSKLDRNEFDSFTERIKELFGSGGDRLPPFPEKFKNGRLAKLAEDIVRELKPEEFGLDPETVKQCEEDPSRAFEILMQSTMKNPGVIQKAMQRIIKKLQDKFQKGEFRPEDLASEAEEMMKEFSENPAFVQMMESLRKTFSFEDPEAAAAAGRPESARLAIAKNRLRQKLAKQNEAKAAAGILPTMPSAAPKVNTVVHNPKIAEGEEFESILLKKKQPKK
jgi:hypothetical protein